jgi:hypothetical protein
LKGKKWFLFDYYLSFDFILLLFNGYCEVCEVASVLVMR